MDFNEAEEKIEESVRDANIRKEDAIDSALLKADKLVSDAEDKIDERKAELTEMSEDLKASVAEKKEQLADRAEELKESLAEKRDDLGEEIRDKRDQAREMGEAAAFAVMMKADDAAAKAEDYHEERKSEIREKYDDFKDTLEFAEKDIDEQIEKKAAALDEKREAFDTWADGVKEDAAEKKEAYTEKAETIRENVKEKTRDNVEEIRGSFQKPDDELEELPVKRREPSIPEYVPKTYVRETPSEPVSDDNSVYNVDDEVEPVRNGVKGSASDQGGEKNDNKLLWIILAVAAAIIIAGCCAFTLVFALMRAAIR